MTEQPVTTPTPEQPAKPPLPEPNPITRRAHRQQSLWQIKLPIAISILLVSVSAVMVLVAGFGQGAGLSTLSDISVIWLIVPMLILGSMLVVVQVALIYMLVRLLPIVPRSSRQMQDFFVLLSKRVRRISDKSTEPFLRVHSMNASFTAFRRSVRQSFRRSRDQK
jgi:hypothetical protein